MAVYENFKGMITRMNMDNKEITISFRFTQFMAFLCVFVSIASSLIYMNMYILKLIVKIQEISEKL